MVIRNVKTSLNLEEKGKMAWVIKDISGVHTTEKVRAKKNDLFTQIQYDTPRPKSSKPDIG